MEAQDRVFFLKKRYYEYKHKFHHDDLFIFFIYTIFQEGDTFGMKAILPCGPLNIKHMKNKLYTYIQIANTNSVHCLSFRHYLKYETINMFSCLCSTRGKQRM